LALEALAGGRSAAARAELLKKRPDERSIAVGSRGRVTGDCG
jgi:hypothetical protein